MSLMDQIHDHPREHFLDFEDAEHDHQIAVFGLGATALLQEAQVELLETKTPS